VISREIPALSTEYLAIFATLNAPAKKGSIKSLRQCCEWWTGRAMDLLATRFTDFAHAAMRHR